MAKITELTALTGSNLANGDLFVVTDVGSPNVSKSITADELAQGSQFSGRYVAKADEKYRFISAPSMAATAGSPALSAIGGGGSHLNAIAWLMDSTNAECVAFTEILPDYWTTFHLDVYWANNAASSGGVGINVRGGFAGDTEVPDGNTFNATLAVAAPTTVGTMKVSRLLTGQTNNTGKPLFLRVCRVPADPGDDLANDAAYYGVLLTRAS